MAIKSERESTVSSTTQGSTAFQKYVSVGVLLFVAVMLFGGQYIADATTAKPIKSDVFSNNKVPFSPPSK